MNEYVLILHEPHDSPFFTMSPAELQEMFARYGAWSKQLAAEGRLKGGHKLQDGTGRQITKSNGQLTITDGPFLETKEVVGGLYVLLAEDFEKAAELASTCPHVEFGRIEVRQIEKL